MRLTQPNDHYRAAEVLAQPMDTDRGQEAPEADLLAVAQIVGLEQLLAIWAQMDPAIVAS
jgi:hypothetical protein